MTIERAISLRDALSLIDLKSLSGWPANIQPPSWVELQQIISLQEAAHLMNVSIDTIERRYRDKIIQLSPRRRGMRLGVALLLT